MTKEFQSQHIICEDVLQLNESRGEHNAVGMQEGEKSTRNSLVHGGDHDLIHYKWPKPTKEDINDDMLNSLYSVAVDYCSFHLK